MPDTVNFDRANKELFCDGEKSKCREDLQNFLDQHVGEKSQEKVYHLLELKSSGIDAKEGVSCKQCVRNFKGDVFLLAHRVSDYMTEYYKTGKKLFINDAFPNEDGR